MKALFEEVAVAQDSDVATELINVSDRIKAETERVQRERNQPKKAQIILKSLSAKCKKELKNAGFMVTSYMIWRGCGYSDPWDACNCRKCESEEKTKEWRVSWTLKKRKAPPLAVEMAEKKQRLEKEFKHKAVVQCGIHLDEREYGIDELIAIVENAQGAPGEANE